MYLRNIVDEMRSHSDRGREYDLVFLGPQSALNALGVEAGEEQETIPEPPPLPLAGHFWFLADNSVGGLATRRLRPDVFWAPGNYPSAVTRLPRVSTIHDLQHRYHPELLGRLTTIQRYALFPLAIRNSRTITVLSESVKAELLRHHGKAIGDTAIVVIPPGVDHVWAELEALGEASSIPEPPNEGNYVIYPAMFRKHKNHAMLVRAFARAVKAGAQCDLLFTGAPGKEAYVAELRELIRGLGLGGRVHFRIDIASHGEVMRLVSGAKGMLFPSRYEGLAISVLEGLALGTPVISSNAVPAALMHPEAVALLDPADEVAWSEAILSLDNSDEALAERALRGVEIINDLSWRLCARRMCDTLLEAS